MAIVPVKEAAANAAPIESYWKDRIPVGQLTLIEGWGGEDNSGRANGNYRVGAGPKGRTHRDPPLG